MRLTGIARQFRAARKLLSRSPLLAMRMVNIGAQFCTSLLAVRLLGLETAGLIFLVQAIWILGRTVGSWGHYWVILQERGRLQGGIRAVWSTAVRRIFLINLALGAVLAGLKAAWPTGPLMSWPLLLAAWAGFAVLGISTLAMASFLTLRRPVRAVSLEMLGLPIIQGLPVLGFGLLGSQTSAAWIVGAQLMLLCLGAYFLCRPLQRPNARGEVAAPYRLPHIGKTLTLWLSDCGTNISLRLPLFLAQALAGPSAAALVAVVQQFGLVGSIFNWAGITGAQASLARAVRLTSPRSVRSVMLGVAPLAVAMNAALLGALLMGGLGIVERFYGISATEFGQGVVILSVMALLDGVFGIGVSALNLSGRERLSAILSVGMCLAIIACGAILFQAGLRATVAAPLALALCWTIRGSICWAIAMLGFGQHRDR